MRSDELARFLLRVWHPNGRSRVELPPNVVTIGDLSTYIQSQFEIEGPIILTRRRHVVSAPNDAFSEEQIVRDVLSRGEIVHVARPASPSVATAAPPQPLPKRHPSKTFGDHRDEPDLTVLTPTWREPSTDLKPKATLKPLRSRRSSHLIQHAPHDILVLIFRFLRKTDARSAAACTCRNWNSAAAKVYYYVMATSLHRESASIHDFSSFADIPTALECVGSDETILLSPGLHIISEPIVIEKAVTLWGTSTIHGVAPSPRKEDGSNETVVKPCVTSSVDYAVTHSVVYVVDESLLLFERGLFAQRIRWERKSMDEAQSDLEHLQRHKSVTSDVSEDPPPRRVNEFHMKQSQRDDKGVLASEADDGAEPETWCPLRSEPALARSVHSFRQTLPLLCAERSPGADFHGGGDHASDDEDDLESEDGQSGADSGLKNFLTLRDCQFYNDRGPCVVAQSKWNASGLDKSYASLESSSASAVTIERCHFLPGSLHGYAGDSPGVIRHCRFDVEGVAVTHTSFVGAAVESLGQDPDETLPEIDAEFHNFSRSMLSDSGTELMVERNVMTGPGPNDDGSWSFHSIGVAACDDGCTACHNRIDKFFMGIAVFGVDTMARQNDLRRNRCALFAASDSTLTNPPPLPAATARPGGANVCPLDAASTVLLRKLLRCEGTRLQPRSHWQGLLLQKANQRSLRQILWFADHRVAHPAVVRVLLGETGGASFLEQRDLLMRQLNLLRNVVADVLKQKQFTCNFVENSIVGTMDPTNPQQRSLSVGALVCMRTFTQAPDVFVPGAFVAQFRYNIIRDCTLSVRTEGDVAHAYFKANTLLTPDDPSWPENWRHSLALVSTGQSDIVFCQNILVRKSFPSPDSDPKSDDEPQRFRTTMLAQGDSNVIADKNVLIWERSPPKAVPKSWKDPLLKARQLIQRQKRRRDYHAFVELRDGAKLWMRENSAVYLKLAGHRRGWMSRGAKAAGLVVVRDVRQDGCATVSNNQILCMVRQRHFPGSHSLSPRKDVVRLADDSAMQLGSVDVSGNYVRRLTQRTDPQLFDKFTQVINPPAAVVGDEVQVAVDSAAVESSTTKKVFSSVHAEQWANSHAQWQKAVRLAVADGNATAQQRLDAAHRGSLTPWQKGTLLTVGSTLLATGFWWAMKSLRANSGAADSNQSATAPARSRFFPTAPVLAVRRQLRR